MNYINAHFRSSDPRAKAMSNLSDHSFVLDGVYCECVEALIQGIKLPPDDPRRELTFVMKGVEAWKMRKHAEGKYVWWDGKVIPYRSPEHAEIIRRGIEAKFAQNPDALEALKSTEGLTIIHEPGGPPESPLTSLPATVYCQILTDIRSRAV